MALNFPDSPTTGDYYTDSNGQRWQFDGIAWIALPRPLTTLSDAAPSDPAVGDTWYETDTATFYLYYDDGSSTQWVSIRPGQIGQLWVSNGSDIYYSDGDVGIGINAPADNLHISSTDPSIRLSDTDAASSGYALVRSNANGSVLLEADPGNVEVTSAIIMQVDGTERFRVNSTLAGDFTGTDAVQLPVGTDAQRPTGAAGMIRYNDDIDEFESYTDGWDTLSGKGTAKAWAFGDASAIIQSYNVTSFVDNGVGDFAVSWINSMSIQPTGSGAHEGTGNRTIVLNTSTTNTEIKVYDPAAATLDDAQWMFDMFGELA